jgi:hypothetical protein
LSTARILHLTILASLLTAPIQNNSSAPVAVQFKDIAGPSGIAFKHALSPEKKYIAESMSGGVALFDYDNDGYLDIFFVNSLTVEMAKRTKNPERPVPQ